MSLPRSYGARMTSRILITGVWLALALPCAAAEPSIRVLLGQDVKTVTAQGDRGVIVRDGKGHERIIAGPVILSATSTGLVANGARLSTKAVTVRSRKGDLSITVGRTGHQRDSQPLPTTTTVPEPQPIRQINVSGVLDVIQSASGLLLINDVG